MTKRDVFEEQASYLRSWISAIASEQPNLIIRDNAIFSRKCSKRFVELFRGWMRDIGVRHILLLSNEVEKTWVDFLQQDGELVLDVVETETLSENESLFLSMSARGFRMEQTVHSLLAGEKGVAHFLSRNEVAEELQRIMMKNKK
ncbi:hypothetical protein SAMN02745116_01932 [Pilibacter termitis]|uniref:Uncharacterized protein n=1 Tax=Pilibacter termitis TaxID=263852 RepID=A0A1T4PUD2_9ENTE|nr:hypothetical protein [Pilibacter termitis]SJZ94837.1 hypothetical protein SAMN02745116_01932 [Pilibacter termitis]